MLTASRAAWFAATFAFVVPGMLMVFRDGGALTQGAWVRGLVFAAIVAAIIAAFFGGGAQ